MERKLSTSDSMSSEIRLQKWREKNKAFIRQQKRETSLEDLFARKVYVILSTINM